MQDMFVQKDYNGSVIVESVLLITEIMKYLKTACYTIYLNNQRYFNQFFKYNNDCSSRLNMTFYFLSLHD